MATDLEIKATDPDEQELEFPREVLTLEQFLTLPEIKPPLEFIRGRIEQKMSPNAQHSRVGTKLPERINATSEPPRLGSAFVELRCSFAGESYVPDISYFCWDRLPLDEKRRLVESVTRAPDWSIEILSPGQTVAKLSSRIRRLLEKGVRLGWLVQPRRSRVMVFLPGLPPRTLSLGDVLDADPVLPGFRLPVDDLFGWLTYD